MSKSLMCYECEKEPINFGDEYFPYCSTDCYEKGALKNYQRPITKFEKFIERMKKE